MKVEKRGKRFDPLRWSMGRAAFEFGFAPNTVKAYLSAISAEPGEDGYFSTTQITDALFSADDKKFDAERLRQQTADADLAEIRRDRELRKIVNIDQVEKAWESVVIPTRDKLQRVASKLSPLLAGKTQHEIEARLTQELLEICEDLSKPPEYFPTTDTEGSVAENNSAVQVASTNADQSMG